MFLCVQPDVNLALDGSGPERRAAAIQSEINTSLQSLRPS